MNLRHKKILFGSILAIGAVCVYLATPAYNSLRSEFLDPNLKSEEQLNTEIISLEKQITENKSLLATLESDIEKLLPEQTSLSANLEKNAQEQLAQCSEGLSDVEQKKIAAQKQFDQTAVDIADQQKIVTTTTARQAELQKNIPSLQKSLTTLTNSIKPDQQKMVTLQTALTKYADQMKGLSVQKDQKQISLDKTGADIKIAQESLVPNQNSVQTKTAQIATNTTKISQNNRQASVNTTLIKSTTTQITAAKSQLSSLQTSINANATKIGNFNTQIATYQKQVVTLQTQLTALQKQTLTRSITSQINKAQSSLTSTQASILTAQKNIDILQAQNTETQKKIDLINLTTLPQLQKTFDTTTTSNVAITNENKNLTTANTLLKSEIVTLNKSLTAAQNTIKTLTAQVKTLTADSVKLETQIDALQVKIDTTNTQIQTLQSKIAGPQTQIDGATQALSSATKELETVKTQGATATAQITKLQADQKTLQASLVEIQKRFDTCQKLDAERSKLQIQFDTVSAEITDKKRDKKRHQLLGEKFDSSLQTAKDELKEFKRKQITCTVAEGDYYFKRADGSTDFSGATLSMGSPDPYAAKFETEYSKTSVIIKADMYIDGVKIQCPDMVTDVSDSDSEPLENCEKMKQELAEEGEDISGMTCTGEYSFMTERHAPKPLMTNVSNTASSFFSSFLKSDIFGGGSDDGLGGDAECNSPNEMVNGNCVPQCNSLQVRDPWGNCSDQTCESPRELVNGTCVDGCQSPQVRDDWGNCSDPACVDPNEVVNGNCVPKCNDPQIRNGDGVCVNPDCPQGQEKINDQCVAVCPDGQSRNQMGACELPACPTGQQRNIDGQCACENGGMLPDCEYNKCGNGTIDSGEECDGDPKCKDCRIVASCGNGTVEEGEACDDGNTADGDGCSSTCTTETSPSCGDGTVDSGEECDDRNNADGDGCDSVCVVECEEDDDGLSSSFFGWFGGFDALKSQVAPGGKKCDKPLGCPHDKPNVSNFTAGTKDPDKNQCQCDNGLDFYAGSLFFDKLHKKDNSCECDAYYFPRDGKCIQECKNGLDKEQYPDCKCPNLGDSVKNGACVPHSTGRIIVTCAANIGINVAAKACGVGWFIPLPSIGTNGRISMNPSRSPMSGR